MIKLLLILVGIICLIGIGIGIGIILCLLAIDDLIPPAWPNYFKRQEEKRKRDKDE